MYGGYGSSTNKHTVTKALNYKKKKKSKSIWEKTQSTF